MITVTKIFRFEAAHALHEYPGLCSHIHGHSYELHVTLRTKENSKGYIFGSGILVDFKEIKALVQESSINLLDHKLILSKNYLKSIYYMPQPQEVFETHVEPTAENMLMLIRDQIVSKLPNPVSLVSLKLWETRDSYAEYFEDQNNPI